MASKILINATHSEEVRVATVENKRLMEYEHDRLDNNTKKGCIYKGVVSRIEPSLNAAFVDYGEERHGFLPASEVSILLHPEKMIKNQRLPIQDLLKKDQEIIVQVEKEEQGNKGAALTTNISLAGCYIVLMPMSPGSGGISRQIDGEEREELQKIINLIDIPEDFSIIVRTASIRRSLEDLLWDFNVLKAQWEAILKCAQELPKTGLLYHDGALLSRVIRDNLKPTVDEILIDNAAVHQEVLQLIQHIRPDLLWKVKFYDPSKQAPLFAAYQIEHEIESIFNPEVILEDGSTLVFDHREALTSIDINSARSTQSSDIAATAFNTNLAAAKEIPRQIRLRNIGGQIIVDFIHMSSSDTHKNADQIKQIENVLKQGLSGDKARVQVGKISKLGLLEISRQRLKTALDKSQLVRCRHCHGRGTHRQPQSVALSILRLIEQEAMNYEKGSILIDVHPAIGSFLFNHYKQNICDLEKRYHFFIHMSEHMEKSAGDYEIKFFKEHHEYRNPSRVIRNYVPAHSSEVLHTPHQHAENVKKGHNSPHFSYTGLEGAAHPANNSFWARIWRFFFGAKCQKIDKNHCGTTHCEDIAVKKDLKKEHPAHHKKTQSDHSQGSHPKNTRKNQHQKSHKKEEINPNKGLAKKIEMPSNQHEPIASPPQINKTISPDIEQNTISQHLENQTIVAEKKPEPKKKNHRNQNSAHKQTNATAGAEIIKAMPDDAKETNETKHGTKHETEAVLTSENRVLEPQVTATPDTSVNEEAHMEIQATEPHSTPIAPAKKSAFKRRHFFKKKNHGSTNASSKPAGDSTVEG